MSEFISLVTQLCKINGVSSDEERVREFIEDKIKNIPDISMKTDDLGNLIVEKKGEMTPKNKVMVCAHMDEVGLIIRDITDKGFLKFAFVGGVDRRVVIGKPVTLGDNQVPGLIGLKAYHMVSKEEESKTPKADDLYIDIGAESKEEAEKLVSLGDFGAFVSEVEPFSNDLFKGKALDDRLGCGIMMTLLEEKLPIDVTFVFTTQEEVGLRGAFGASFSVAPDIALILETTTAADLPEIPKGKQVCHVGKGPVISHMDGGTIYDRKLFELLRATAMSSRIPWQMKEYIAGGNDSRAIQRSKSGVRVAGISAPVRYLHAPTSVGSVSDFENCLALARNFILKLAQEEQ
ncbi:MAG: M42 family metallopeptidase [Eubacteriales bacterium]